MPFLVDRRFRQHICHTFRSVFIRRRTAAGQVRYNLKFNHFFPDIDLFTSAVFVHDIQDQFAFTLIIRGYGRNRREIQTATDDTVKAGYDNVIRYFHSGFRKTPAGDDRHRIIGTDDRIRQGVNLQIFFCRDPGRIFPEITVFEQLLVKDQAAFVHRLAKCLDPGFREMIALDPG